MDNVDPNWWKRLFDEIYLITDARSVCDDALTLREVDFLERVLNLEKSWPILDLCGGQGRQIWPKGKNSRKWRRALEDA